MLRAFELRTGDAFTRPRAAVHSRPLQQGLGPLHFVGTAAVRLWSTDLGREATTAEFTNAALMRFLSNLQTARYGPDSVREYAKALRALWCHAHRLGLCRPMREYSSLDDAASPGSTTSSANAANSPNASSRRRCRPERCGTISYTFSPPRS